ncbi:BON domain-containing protein [Burkholderia sp. WSM2230]|uniref:BON domain-containing protein n=1 Tax=Burkholderia sp. WSM2230 TaxID=944435 RepID=UPI0003FFDE75|nr:BON domain-containing protein [Burkholderia sp. WSM2230]
MAHSRFATPHNGDSDHANGVRLSDDAIAAEAMRRLAWDAAVPRRTIDVEVHDGCVTLHGELEQPAQKLAALQDVTRLFGVSGVCDRLVVKEA